jgi:hypothetical protein
LAASGERPESADGYRGTDENTGKGRESLGKKRNGTLRKKNNLILHFKLKNYKNLVDDKNYYNTLK